MRMCHFKELSRFVDASGWDIAGYTGIYERLKFAAAFWITSARAEATGGKLFPTEGIHIFVKSLELYQRDGIRGSN